MSQMDVGGMLQGASLLSRPAEEYVNDASVEAMWVVKACDYADVYFSLITTVDPKLLKLTTDDERIYKTFRKYFPVFELKNVDEGQLKAEANKILWRAFCEELKNIEDYSFGTLLRLDCQRDFSQENTILVPRVQFLAIEIARNRTGLNDYVWKSSPKVLLPLEPKELPPKQDV